MDYVANVFQEVTGHYLDDLSSYTGLIWAGGYYHWKVKQLKQLRHCPHLRGKPVPEGPLVRPSSRQQSQQSHWFDKPKVSTTRASGRDRDEESPTPEELEESVQPPQAAGGAGDAQSWYARTVQEEEWKKANQKLAAEVKKLWALAQSSSSTAGPTRPKALEAAYK